MKRGVFAIACVLTACGGSSPPPESAASAPDGDEPRAGASEPAASDTPKESSEGQAEGESSEASSGDLEKVIQLVIDDEDLQQFLKLGEPGRFPVKMSGEHLSGLSLTKGTQPVVVVDGPKDAKDAVLVITKIELGPKHGTVSYRYDVEGVRGTATVEKGAYGWELKSSRIVER